MKVEKAFRKFYTNCRTQFFTKQNILLKKKYDKENDLLRFQT